MNWIRTHEMVLEISFITTFFQYNEKELSDKNFNEKMLFELEIIFSSN